MTNKISNLFICQIPKTINQMAKDPDKNIKTDNFFNTFFISTENILRLIVYAGNILVWGPTSHGKSEKSVKVIIISDFNQNDNVKHLIEFIFEYKGNAVGQDRWVIV